MHGSCMLLFLLLCIFVGHGIAAIDESTDASTFDKWDPISTCPSLPLCSHGSPSLLFKLRHCFLSAETPFRDPAFRKQLLENLHELLIEVQGQSHVIPVVYGAVLKKLQRLDERVILHFAGDHGVGKTLVARLISLAWSLRCAAGAEQRGATNGRHSCSHGDAMLIISGTGYDGLPIQTSRKMIVDSISKHAQRHPHGIVLIDDLTAMHPDLVLAISSILGRSSTFAEAPHVDLEKLFVIVTTDFGTEGKTRNKTLPEIQEMVIGEFSTTFGSFTGSFMQVVPFVPLTPEAARNIVRETVDFFTCRDRRILTSTISDQALTFIADSIPHFQFENGHALKRKLEGTFQMDASELLGGLAVDELVHVHYTLVEGKLRFKVAVSNNEL